MVDNDPTRVPFITSRSKVPPEGRDHYDLIEDTRGEVIGPFKPLLNSPEVAGRVAHLGTYIRYESSLPGDVRELAIITTARQFDAAFEWAAHEPIAREEGVRDETIELVAENAGLSEFPEAERQIVRVVRELLGAHAISDEAFAAIKERFGTQGVTELIATIGFYSMIACILNGFEVTPGEDAPTLP